MALVNHEVVINNNPLAVLPSEDPQPADTSCLNTCVKVYGIWLAIGLGFAGFIGGTAFVCTVFQFPRTGLCEEFT